MESLTATALDIWSDQMLERQQIDGKE